MQTAAMFQNLVSCLCRERFKGSFSTSGELQRQSKPIFSDLVIHEWQQQSLVAFRLMQRSVIFFAETTNEGVNVLLINAKALLMRIRHTYLSLC